MKRTITSSVVVRTIALAAMASTAQVGVAGVVLSNQSAQRLQLAVAKRAVQPGQPILIGDMVFGRDVLSIKGFTPGNRWPSGAVPVTFDPSLDITKRNAFLQACALWNSAGMSCVPRTTQANYVKVQQRSGQQCYGSDNVSCAHVGMRGGEQYVAISVKHWGDRSLIAHEFGHTLGLVHEHMRSDRNGTIQIFMQNALPGSEGDLNAIGGRYLSAYDFKSIMHYPSCAFSRFADCATNPAHRVIEIKHCRYKDTPKPLGQPTDFDIFSVRALYGLPATVNPIGYVPPFQPVQVPCGPSCRTVGGIKYGRVNYNEFSYGIPPVPNPPPTLEQRVCRGFGQAALPNSKITRSKRSKGRMIVKVKGDCGCPNAV